MEKPAGPSAPERGYAAFTMYIVCTHGSSRLITINSRQFITQDHVQTLGSQVSNVYIPLRKLYHMQRRMVVNHPITEHHSYTDSPQCKLVQRI